MSLPKRLRGFTLIEAVLVVSVISWISLSGFFLTNQILRRQALRGSAQQLVTAIREVQNNASTGLNLCPPPGNTTHTRPDGWYIQIIRQSNTYNIGYRCKDASGAIIAAVSKTVKYNNGIESRHIRHHILGAASSGCNSFADYYLYVAPLGSGFYWLFGGATPQTKAITSSTPVARFLIKLQVVGGSTKNDTRVVEVKFSGSALEKPAVQGFGLCETFAEFS